jgi:hypothetical protein
MFTNRRFATVAFGSIIGFAALSATVPSIAMADYPWGKSSGSDTQYVVSDYPWGKAGSAAADDYPWGKAGSEAADDYPWG